MEKVLFNFHDLILILTVSLCFLLAVICYLNFMKHHVSATFGVLFFLVSAAIPIDTLISFGAAFKPHAIENFPHLFYVFETAYWLQAPLLLFFVRSIIYKNKALTWPGLILFAPCVLFLMHQIMAYHSLPSNEKVELLLGHTVQNQSFSVYYVVFLREALRFGFSLFCAYIFFDYFSRLEKSESIEAHKDLLWLKVLVIGVSFITGLALLNSGFLILSVNGFKPPVDIIGLTSNYLTCLLFFAITALKGMSPVNLIKLDLTTQSKAGDVHINSQHVEAIEQAMSAKKLYLDSDLTLDSLSQALSLSPKTVSNVINRHYQCNFFEFINGYRLNEAKRLMTSEQYEKCTILDIMHQTGFNSKATFNAFFKKKVGMTPRQFRKTGH